MKSIPLLVLFSICIIGLGLSSLYADGTSVSVITAAQNVANTRYANFHYGEYVEKHEVNCVQFLGAVIEKIVNRPLSPEEINAIYIKGSFENLSAAVENSDDRTKGVAFALAKVMKVGNYVSVNDAKVGDFIQYWIRNNDGTWMGHAAIISEVWHDTKGSIRCGIFGAHHSTNGIGFTKFSKGEGLALDGQDRRVYLCRFDPSVTLKIK